MLLVNGEYHSNFIKSIKNAKHAILGFVFHDSLFSEVNGSIIDYIFSELRQAKNRGVSVKILCHSAEQIEKIRRYNIDVKKVSGYKTMHSKAFCFDNKELYVGSHNMSINAMTVNLEMSAIINDEESIKKFNQHFNIIWQS